MPTRNFQEYAKKVLILNGSECLNVSSFCFKSLPCPALVWERSPDMVVPRWPDHTVNALLVRSTKTRDEEQIVMRTPL